MCFAFRLSLANSVLIYPASSQPRTHFPPGSTSVPKMVSVPDAASGDPRSKPKIASLRFFAWPLSRFTIANPTWATITALNALDMVHRRRSKTRLTKHARIFFHLVTTCQPYDETVFAKLEARNQQRQFRKLQSLAKQMGYSLWRQPHDHPVP